MPFTYEMIAKNETVTGKFIIDRQNVIFLFHPTSDHEKGYSPLQLRDLLAEYFGQFPITRMEGKNCGLIEGITSPNDPSHAILNHVSHYDKDTCHYHIRYNRPIDFAVIKTIFANIAEYAACFPELDKLMSVTNRSNILVTAKAYFDEMQFNSEAKKIEMQYRVGKELELNTLQCMRNAFPRPKQKTTFFHRVLQANQSVEREQTEPTKISLTTGMSRE